MSSRLRVIYSVAACGHVAALFGSVFALSLTLAQPVGADDRDLLKSQSVKPYVMVLLDTSGSMNWSPPCSASDFAANKCGFLCPNGDCFVPRNGDDPASKFRQAREALAEVISQTQNAYWGFATYNADKEAAFNKHWLYKVSASQPGVLKGLATSTKWTSWPVVGAEEVFGVVDVTGSITNALQWPDGNAGSAYNNPVTLPTSSASAPNFNLERVRRLPKGDASTRPNVIYWVKDSSLPSSNGNQLFRITYRLNSSQTLGAATVQALVSIDQCKKSDCSQFNSIAAAQPVNFDLVGSFLMWDSGGTKPSGGTSDYFSYDDTTSTNNCSGWEPNTDNSSDKYSGYSMKYPDTTSGQPRDYGDVTPLDWEKDNQALLRARLAPDGTAAVSGESYTSSKYFADARAGSDTFLRLADASQVPLIPNGSTPLGATMLSFRKWYTGSTTAQGPLTASSWRAQAIAQDPNWACRKVYVLFITDGDETCSGDPCTQTAALNTWYDTKTFVVGFGLQSGSGNKLGCMAANGGTVAPILPQNKQDLVKALNTILSKIREDSAAFASAAVPSVQAQVADKVYLTNFTPVTADDPAKPPAVNVPSQASAIWAGHIQAFLKPLPASTATGFVDDTRCAPGQTASCLAWDSGPTSPVVAGEGIVSQAPSAADIAAGDRHLGTGVNQRRVYYADGSVTNAVPATMKLFQPPTAAADKLDLWAGMGISNSGSGDATALAQSTAVQDFTLVKKHTEINREVAIPHHPNPEPIDYILGDIFHSNPVVVNNPSDFRNFLSNTGFAAGQSTDCRDTTNPNRGYQCFFYKHRCRRRMLFVGSNDGQLHAIDAGIFAVKDPNNHNLLQCNDLTPSKLFTTLPEPIGFFNLGTGKELFSFIPRAALPKLVSYYNTGAQDWSVDGTPVPADVLIDPSHTGTPVAADREWRTVVISGMREGGNEYFALDVTQPDTYDAFQVPQVTGVSSTLQVPPGSGYVPSCASGGSGCGTQPFPTVLWEFSDKDLLGATTDPIDEDPASVPAGSQPGSMYPDLAQTWSTPNIGRIRVCDGINCDPNAANNNIVDKWVAVFGGGLDGKDPAKPFFARSGNWLYMVDIETGKVIYKRQLDGAVPSEPAAVDENQDGYLDTIFIGTTTGYMYKVDMTTVPQLQSTVVTYHRCPAGTCTATTYTATVKRIVDSAWTPFKVFDTISGVRRPIYYAPAVIFVGQLGQYALAFGTGNRENLWASDGTPGRFYMVTDTGFTRAMALAGTLPLNESNFPILDATSAAAPRDYVLNPDTASHQRSGWIMRLNADERVISSAFALSGITTFTGYTPTVGISSGAGGNLCAKGGESRIFTVLTTTADAVQYSGSTPTRFVLKDSFVTNPFTEQAQTKNSSASDQSGTPLDSNQEALFEKLKTLFPSNCRFSNFRIDIKTVRADTKVVLIAPVPICIVSKNWKEF